MERIEELESLIDQLEMNLAKADAQGADREAGRLRKEIKKFEMELAELQRAEMSCSCSIR